jgi:chromosome segregation ATPase
MANAKRVKTVAQTKQKIEKSIREKLETQLGQLAYRIGKKQQELQAVNVQLQGLQAEANDIATQIEKLDVK